MQFQTQRLLIRPYTLDDVAAAHAELDSHPDVWRFDPGAPLSLERRRQTIEQRISAYGGPIFGALAVTLRDDGQFIGYCGLQLYLCNRGAHATPEVELFYKLGRNHWGKGYALEACREMVRHAFEDLRLTRIVTCTASANEGSIKLLTRLGMRIEPDITEPDAVLATLDNPAVVSAHG